MILQPSSSRNRYEADVVVIGAGPAGTAIASGLAKDGRRVLVLESGGFDSKPDHDAGAGQIRGDMPYHRLAECRARGLGGSSALWGGWIVALDELDLEAHPRSDLNGWCVSRADLEPDYRRALSFIGVPQEMPARDWSVAGGSEFAASPFEAHRFPAMGRLQLGHRHADVFAGGSTDLALGLTVKLIVTTPDGSRVDHVVVGTAHGEAIVSGNTFVLATGGIENPRLLLASANRAWPSGLGNAHGLVGRYFMEHPHVDALRFSAGTADLDPDFFTKQAAGLDLFGAAIGANGSFSLSDDFRKAQGIGNAELFIEPAGLHTEGRIPMELDGRPRPLRHHEDPSDDLALVTVTEQMPNPHSRVTLGEARDRNGVPLPVLRWELNEFDLRTVRTSVAAAEELFLALGAKDMRTRLQGDRWPQDTVGGLHHLGTTRMADSPSAGVVDGDCRVHGVDNLYIAGGSVFPTSGYAPPTLTIVALALRLANHLTCAGAAEEAGQGADVD